MKPLDEPGLPGTSYKVIGGEGFDDGGVADLTLLIDLDDNVQRRRRGDSEYFSASRANLLPRATKGPLARLDRRDQKVHLAQLLFSEEDDSEEKGPSEIYVDQVDGHEDQATLRHRMERLTNARAALTLSILLREPACAAISLAEICKRRLTLLGKAGAEDALRCADKSIQIAGEGFYDNDEIAIEVSLYCMMLRCCCSIVPLVETNVLTGIRHTPCVFVGGRNSRSESKVRSRPDDSWTCQSGHVEATSASRLVSVPAICSATAWKCLVCPRP